jgi:hypothetical protein
LCNKKHMTNREKFARLIESQKKSGLTVKMFCSNEGIAPSSFYYWQKRIRQESVEKRFIPLVVKTPETSLQTVTRTGLTQEQRDRALFEIIYPNGTTLRIKNDMDIVGLRTLISLLD